MGYEDIDLQTSDGVAVLTLRRPDRLNAVRGTTFYELAAAFDVVQRDREARVLILTGEGRGFCSGLDVGWEEFGEDLPELASRLGLRTVPVEPSARMRRLNDTAMQRLAALTIPTIAAVNGVAVGAGFSLALACDIRYASTSARFRCIFAQRGSPVHAGMSYYLPRIVGASRALEMVLSDEEVPAEDAASMGLVSKVVAPEELLPAAQRLASRIAKQSRAVVESDKQAIQSELWTSSLASKIGDEWWAAYASRSGE